MNNTALKWGKEGETASPGDNEVGLEPIFKVGSHPWCKKYLVEPTKGLKWEQW